MCLLATPFAERVAAADVNGRPCPQVRKREVDSAIAAESRAQQREERLVLVDGQELAVAQGPSLRGKHEAHDPDFRQKRFCHPRPSLCRQSVFQSSSRQYTATEATGCGNQQYAVDTAI